MLSDWIMVPCLLGSIKVLYVYSRCYLDIQNQMECIRELGVLNWDTLLYTNRRVVDLVVSDIQ